MLIVDIPMQAGCDKCIFMYGRCILDFSHDPTHKITVLVTSKKAKIIDYRPDWCPIKGELPDEHGDLIDRDETFHAAQPQGCTDEHWAETTLGRVVLEAKTVIAAERKDDGTTAD